MSPRIAQTTGAQTPLKHLIVKAMFPTIGPGRRKITI
jgi:hypothetical protein